MLLRRRQAPGSTGFFDHDRTSSGSSYHDRMVERRAHKRLVLALAVVLAIILAIVCAFVMAQRG